MLNNINNKAKDENKLNSMSNCVDRENAEIVGINVKNNYMTINNYYGETKNGFSVNNKENENNYWNGEYINKVNDNPVKKIDYGSYNNMPNKSPKSENWKNIEEHNNDFNKNKRNHPIYNNTNNNNIEINESIKKQKKLNDIAYYSSENVQYNNIIKTTTNQELGEINQWSNMNSYVENETYQLYAQNNNNNMYEYQTMNGIVGMDLNNNVTISSKYADISFPMKYEDAPNEWYITSDNSDWVVNKQCNWLYNFKDKLYFNIKSQEIYFEENCDFFLVDNSIDKGEKENNGYSEYIYEDNKNMCEYNENKYFETNIKKSYNEEIPKSEGNNKSSKHNNCSTNGNIQKQYSNENMIIMNDNVSRNNMVSAIILSSNNINNNGNIDNAYDNDNIDNVYNNEETVEEFSMILEDDLVCGTCSKIGSHNRNENEDFYITKDILDLNNVSENDSLCFFSAIFDGHGGSNCARYVMSHLKTNLIAKFRQSFLITCKKHYKEKNTKINELSVAIKALYDSCIKGFEMTDKNYLELSKKYDYKDGATSCVVLIYGPDEDGSLKVLCANCGDSCAFICHDRKPIKLSLQHKPDLQEERIRILRCGGIIANINGINRIITKHKDKNSNNREKTFLALSTSRSFGDIPYKIPKKIVLCKPFISVYTIDFDLDSFLVLATDGILNVLTDVEIIDIIWKNIHQTPEYAAEEVVKEATKRGSTDDKTCTVIFFNWRKDIFNKNTKNVNFDGEIPQDYSNPEDINMFSEI
ncbi:protein phosphatase PPM4 [Plasmodium berghei]|uniref:Protein phosphatase PPM4 n=1 Tax=Plasmodium berghei TaxID=5821 RepID=A0A0Z0BC94_PLABE|nr:protein phosphatase PPM4 [Plasmodium berghei]